jgi:tRNA(adenine34) deaminase
MTTTLRAGHDRYMEMAIELAREALAKGDWPVAAVIVCGDRVLARGRGRQNTARDPSAHAETEALREARALRADLSGATLYCTMEPCPMCAFALHLHGLDRIVLGARHADLGRTDLGRYSLEGFADMMGYRIDLVTGVRREECIALRREWGRDVTADAS